MALKMWLAFGRGEGAVLGGVVGSIEKEKDVDSVIRRGNRRSRCGGWSFIVEYQCWLCLMVIR